MTNPILARLQDQPALIDEGHGAWLEACLAVVNERSQELEKVSASAEDFWDDGYSWVRPYVVRYGILQVPVKGVLLHDFPYAFGGWATGYEYIWAAVKRGLEDSNVKGIALVVNSGGGMVSGNWDLVDRIHDARSSKPIRSFAAEHAYSAAYNIAAAAEHITVARTGGVGSIGVVVTHFEYSKLLDQNGVTVNIIRSKPDKMEGNPYEALSDGAHGRIKERVDEFHTQFVAMVARNRAMDVAKVDATDAHTFMAQQAVENGLADEIGALDDALTAFAATLQLQGDEPMAVETQAGITEDQLATATAEAEKRGAAAERTRITTILGSDEAKERPAAALMMVNLGVAAEQSAIELAKLPVEVKQEATTTPAQPGAGAPKGMFQAAMKGSENPNISADDEEQPKPMSRVERTLLMTKGPRKSAATKE